MNDIRVNKAKLIEIMEENRDDHMAAYEQALVVFRERVLAELEGAINIVKGGKPIGKKQLVISLPIPEDHTADYDRVLRMLELSLDDEIMLSEYDATRYVEDTWEWAASFASNTTSYLSS